jgi:hypothetical protein
MNENTLIKSRVIKIQIKELSSDEAKALTPQGNYEASKATEISFKLVGYDKTEDELNTRIVSKVNDLISEQKAQVQGKTIDDIKRLLDFFIKMEIKNVIDSSSIYEVPVTIQNGKIQVVYSFNPDLNRKTNNYVARVKSLSSDEEVRGQIVNDKLMQFETSIIGKMIIIGKSGSTDIYGSQYEDEIKVLQEKYEFSSELSNGRFRPEVFATREDIINFAVNILNPQGEEYAKLGKIEKAKKIGLLGDFPAWNLKEYGNREELAYIISKLYEIKTGVNPEDIITNNISISDGDNITPKFKKRVYWVVDKKIIKCDSGKLFLPDKKVARGEVASSLAGLLEMLGE